MSYIIFFQQRINLKDWLKHISALCRLHKTTTQKKNSRLTPFIWNLNNASD